MSRTRKAPSSSWDPTPPSRFADFYAACQARYTPPTLLERLIHRVPDAISMSCRDCGTNFLQALGGPLECHVCGAREIDTLREELEDMKAQAEEAERLLANEEESNVRLDRELTTARHDLDDRDKEIERLTARVAELEHPPERPCECGHALAVHIVDQDECYCRHQGCQCCHFNRRAP